MLTKPLLGIILAACAVNGGTYEKDGNKVKCID
jgi:hypothetical protein